LLPRRRPFASRLRAVRGSRIAGWDALGIGAALHVDSVIHTECPDCHTPLAITVRNEQPDDGSLVFHVLVPATEWWNDIGYT
jgi:hypothetical protein